MLMYCHCTKLQQIEKKILIDEDIILLQMQV